MSRHNMTHQCLRLNHQKSFIQKSFGISRHLVTQRVKNTRKAASLGLEPRQRDPESLVLPLHHEALRDGKIMFRPAFATSGRDLFLYRRGQPRLLSGHMVETLSVCQTDSKFAIGWTRLPAGGDACAPQKYPRWTRHYRSTLTHREQA